MATKKNIKKKVTAKTKPAPKPTKAPRTQFYFYLGLANIKNGDGSVKQNLTREQVRADAKSIASLAGVAFLQEIFEYDDWVDVRNSIPKHYAMSSSGKRGERHHVNGRGNTTFWNTKKFTKKSDKALKLPGNNDDTPGPEQKGGQTRYLREVILTVNGKPDAPEVVLLNLHLAHGTTGKDKKLNNPVRKKWWEDQHDFVEKTVAKHQKAGRIVVLGGDWNRGLKRLPVISGEIWVIGDKKREQIDGACVFLPEGWSVKVSMQDTRDVNSDHHQRRAKVEFQKA